MAQLAEAAAGCWWQPHHPGFAIAPLDSERFVTSLAGAGGPFAVPPGSPLLATGGGLFQLSPLIPYQIFGPYSAQPSARKRAVGMCLSVLLAKLGMPPYHNNGQFKLKKHALREEGHTSYSLDLVILGWKYWYCPST